MKSLKALCLCTLWTVILVCACNKPTPEPIIEIATPTTVDVASGSQTATISFTANNPWTATSSNGWCKVSPASGAASDKAATVTVTLDPNEAFEPRTATVTIKAGGIEKTVTITQAAAEKPADYIKFLYLAISGEENALDGDIPYEGGDFEIRIASNMIPADTDFINKRISVSTRGGCSEWVMPTGKQRHVRDDIYAIEIHVSGNSSQSPRTGKVEIGNVALNAGVEVTLTQEGGPAITPLQAVDLGLKVIWADRNLGAESPSDFGNYYAWGETEPKDFYDWSNYKWATGSKFSLTKYNTRSECGTVDNSTRLLKEDDAAAAATDGVWRMPTREELQNLLSSCVWEKTTIKTEDGDVFGYTVKSATTDNSIFLPAAGCIAGTTPNKANEYGLYPSSDVCTAENNRYGYKDDYCWYLFFQSGEKIIYGDSRARGWAIRPVKDK